MIRVLLLSLILPDVAAGLFAAADAGIIEFIETFVAVFLIVGFVIVGAGWAIRHV